MAVLPPTLLKSFPDMRKLELKYCDKITAVTLGSESKLEHFILYSLPELKHVVPCLPVTLKELHVSRRSNLFYVLIFRSTIVRNLSRFRLK